MKACEQLVTVATFGNALEASVAKCGLEAAGIRAFVPGESLGAFAVNRSVPQQTWVELKVGASDRSRAIELLKRARRR